MQAHYTCFISYLDTMVAFCLKLHSHESFVGEIMVVFECVKQHQNCYTQGCLRKKDRNNCVAYFPQKPVGRLYVRHLTLYEHTCSYRIQVAQICIIHIITQNYNLRTTMDFRADGSPIALMRVRYCLQIRDGHSRNDPVIFEEYGYSGEIHTFSSRNKILIVIEKVKYSNYPVRVFCAHNKSPRQLWKITRLQHVCFTQKHTVRIKKSFSQ